MEPPSSGQRWLYGGLACVTAATLVLELSLTRIFSVVMYYHFAFLAISLALFGLGAAGIYLYLRPNVASGPRLHWALQRYALAAAASTVFAIYFVLDQKVSLEFARDNLWTLTKIYLVTAIPFFFSGLCVTAMINRFRSDMGRLYFFDLAGAGLGCLALTSILALLGGINTVLACAVLFALGAVLFEVGDRGGARSAFRWAAPILLSIGAVAVVLVNYTRPVLLIPSVKGTHEGRVVFSKWNSFSRVTVEQRSGDHLWLKMDSSAATRIFSKDVAAQGFEPTRRFSETRVASLVYSLRKPGKALIIGPGGGADVIAALYFGQKDVTGVELNPIIANDVMKERFVDYNGGLYLRPDVNIHAAEGRSFIRSSDRKYDSIQATLVDTWAATAAGAFTLSENTLYTRNAFGDYLQHLTNDGVLTMTRWMNRPPREFLRLLVVGRAALDDMGIGQHHRHFYVAADRRMATMLLKRSPFTEKETATLDAYVSEAKLRRLYSPFDSTMRNAYAELLRSSNWREYVERKTHDLSPPSDDRPFFFYTVKPQRLLEVFKDAKRLTEHNLGLLMLLVALALVAALVLLFFVLPLFLFRRDVLRGDRIGKARYLGYFVALGAGFITVEIALMQKFILFLGHPTFALIVVLFALLIFSGIGSYLCRNVAEARSLQVITRNLGLFAVLLVVYLLTLSPLFNWLVGLPLGVRIPLAVLLVSPLGLLMGTFLPLGVQGAGERFAVVVPWAWGLNGAASVFGSVLAIALAMNLGFNVSLVVGLLFYGTGLLALRGVLGSTTAKGLEA